MTDTTVRRNLQQLDPGTLVELFQLDTTPLTNIYGQTGTGTVYSWTPGGLNDAPIVFGGVTYQPTPVEVTEMERNGQGKLPMPKLRVTNIGGLAAALVIEFGDCLGATVTRIRTFAQYLDGQSEADSSAIIGPDVFTVNRKSAHNKAYIEWELLAPFDAQGVKLPKRQVIRDSCTLTYRYWDANTGVFVYGTCPYNGPFLFKADDSGAPDSASDVCGKRMSSCLARFGTAPLPFGGFPGVAIPQ